jgi:type 1 fimbria pilin
MKYAPMTSRFTKQFAALLLAVGLMFPLICSAVATKPTTGGTHTLLATAQASSTQPPECTPSTASATITIPSPVSIAPGTANGLIGNAGSVTISMNCTNAFLNTTNLDDDFSLWTGIVAALDSTNAPPGGTGIMFQTNVPGIDIRLTASTVQASSSTTGPNGMSGWTMGQIDCSGYTDDYNCTNSPLSVKFTAQLVKTGPIAPGTISSIQLLEFYDFDTVPKNANDPENFTSPSNSFGTLTVNAVTLNMSTCSVTAGSANLSVTLPTIVTSALATTNSVAGQTAFQIQYTCPSGWALYMTMSTANPGSVNGVIMPSTSCSAGTPATNVGIQLLQSTQQAVQFNTAQSVGNSPNGTLSLNYYAQYYATGSPISSGAVCGTATFTMSYQ